MAFPERRLRRLRRTPALRRLVAETRLTVDDLVAPLFVREGIVDPQPIVSLPGVVQHTRESLRQEVTTRSVRVSLVEPGAVATELIDHLSPQALEGFWSRFGGVERLLAEDVADTISFIVTRPRRVAINEVLLRPTDQEG